MYGGRRNGWDARPTAALLVLAAHGLFIMLLLMEKRAAPRAPPPSRQLVAIPITLRGLEIRLEPPPVAAPRPDLTPTPRLSTPAFQPATAITLAPVSSEPAERAVPASGASLAAAAADLAASYAEQLEAPAPAFSPPPVTVRAPCEPRKQSFKFKGDVKESGGSVSLTLGWEKQDPDKHYFDDMMAGKGAISSVPDPDICD